MLGSHKWLIPHHVYFVYTICEVEKEVEELHARVSPRWTEAMGVDMMRCGVHYRKTVNLRGPKPS
jgi:hypothetical protein